MSEPPNAETVEMKLNDAIACIIHDHWPEKFTDEQIGELSGLFARHIVRTLGDDSFRRMIKP